MQECVCLHRFIHTYIIYLKGDIFVPGEIDCGDNRDLYSTRLIMLVKSYWGLAVLGDGRSVSGCSSQIFTMQGLIDGQFADLIFCSLNISSSFFLGCCAKYSLKILKNNNRFRKELCQQQELNISWMLCWGRVQRESFGGKYENYTTFGVKTRILKACHLFL